MFFTKGDKKDANGVVAVEHETHAAPLVRQLKDLDKVGVVASDELSAEGWTVHSADGRKVGSVDSLIVDTSTMKVRYLDVTVDKDIAKASDARYVRVPAKRRKAKRKSRVGRFVLLGAILGLGSMLLSQLGALRRNGSGDAM